MSKPAPAVRRWPDAFWRVWLTRFRLRRSARRYFRYYERIDRG